MRRTGLLRSHGRSRLQEDISFAAGDDQARHAQCPDHRRGQERMEPRAAAGARSRQPRASRRYRYGGIREAHGAAALHRRRLRGPGNLQAAEKGAGLAPQRPAHYLAIPPTLFGDRGRASGGGRVRARRRASGRRKAVRPRPRFGARPQPDLAARISPRSGYSASTTISARARYTTCSFSGSAIRCTSPCGTGSISRAFRLTMAEDFGIQGRGAFYDSAGTIRDVIQNHLFQVLSNLAMEPPARTDSESIRDEKVKVLKSIRALGPDDVVRGQFRGYREEKGVARGFPSGDVCGGAPHDRQLALARRPFLHPRRQIAPGDLHGNGRASAPAALHSVRALRHQLLALSDRSDTETLPSGST